jgi:hypothetical protein
MFSLKCFKLIVVPVAMISVAAAAAQSRKTQGNTDQKELYNYVLTMDKVQKLVSATNGLSELGAHHPELYNSGETLDQVTQRFQKYPDVTATLSQNGLTPREYVVGTITLVQADMAVNFKKAGTYKEYPPDVLKVVSPENLAFVEKHCDEVNKALSSSSSKKDSR